MADIVNLRLHSFGNIELLTRTPLALKAGLGMDLVNFLWVTLLFGVIGYFLANIMIKKFNFATPGRNGNYEVELGSEAGATAGSGASQEVKEIVALLGGRQNIHDIDACMTRLRVTVKDPSLVGDEEAWRKAGALGLVIRDNGIQAVYGPKADTLKSDIQDAIDDGEV